MKIKIILLVLFFVSVIDINVQASESKERIYLIQILNQLNAIKPLIIAASLQQPKTNRIQFHYGAYKDANKKQHNGLLDDINQIERGIQNKLNHVSSEPSLLPPIKGDYIVHGRREATW